MFPPVKPGIFIAGGAGVDRPEASEFEPDELVLFTAYFVHWVQLQVMHSMNEIKERTRKAIERGESVSIERAFAAAEDDAQIIAAVAEGRLSPPVDSVGDLIQSLKEMGAAADPRAVAKSVEHYQRLHRFIASVLRDKRGFS